MLNYGNKKYSNCRKKKYLIFFLNFILMHEINYCNRGFWIKVKFELYKNNNLHTETNVFRLVLKQIIKTRITCCLRQRKWRRHFKSTVKRKKKVFIFRHIFNMFAYYLIKLKHFLKQQFWTIRTFDNRANFSA